jgi:hypothetical protein
VLLLLLLLLLLGLQGGSVRLLSDVGLSTLCSTLLGKPLGAQGSCHTELIDTHSVTDILQQRGVRHWLHQPATQCTSLHCNPVAHHFVF